VNHNERPSEAHADTENVGCRFLSCIASNSYGGFRMAAKPVGKPVARQRVCMVRQDSDRASINLKVLEDSEVK